MRMLNLVRARRAVLLLVGAVGLVAGSCGVGVPARATSWPVTGTWTDLFGAALQLNGNPFTCDLAMPVDGHLRIEITSTAGLDPEAVVWMAVNADGQEGYLDGPVDHTFTGVTDVVWSAGECPRLNINEFPPEGWDTTSRTLDYTISVVPTGSA